VRAKQQKNMTGLVELACFVCRNHKNTLQTSPNARGASFESELAVVTCPTFERLWLK